jgi:aryl-alcohol dehydrogenase-like predicted oxidoreductase
MSISIADQINLKNALPKTVAHNIGVLAKRPLANAAWKELDQQQGLYKSYAKPYHDRLRTMKLNPLDLRVPGPMDEGWPELAMRFTLSHPGVHCAIIGTTNPQNAEMNLRHAAKGPLPADVVLRIAQAFAAADPDGKWAGQT